MNAPAPTELLAEKARKLLGALYKTADVMKSARNSKTNMNVWADDMKAVEDVMSFLETLRDQPAPQSEVQSEDATYEQSAILTALMNRAFAAERTLENIRDNAATMSNGGAWAAGLAVIRLAASERSSTSESLDLADHDEISRKVLGLPWAVQSAIVTIAAHCTVIKDKSPAGDVSDLAGCISQDLLELANALSGGVAQAVQVPCPVCGGEAIHALDVLKRTFIQQPEAWDAPHNRSYEPVETMAKVIYDSFVYDGPAGTKKPAWTHGGNGTKQDEARDQARCDLRQAGHSPSVPSAPAQAVQASSLSKRLYALSEPHLSGYRLVLGFETLAECQAAREAIAVTSVEVLTEDAAAWQWRYVGEGDHEWKTPSGGRKITPEELKRERPIEQRPLFVGPAQEPVDCGKVRELLGPFYQTVDVMVSAHNNEPNRMCVWASDVKAVQDVMLFLESLRDLASPVPSASRGTEA